MKLGSVCYLPSNHPTQTSAFLANLRQYPSGYPVYFYSDAPKRLKKGESLTQIDNPEVVSYANNAWSVPKLVFIEGIQLAVEKKLDYFIMLEDDCRVQGAEWDRTIFNEFLGATQEGLNGGTFYAFNMFNDTAAWSEAFWQWTIRYQDKHRAHPAIMTFGIPGCAEKAQAKVFTNGALSVYHTQTLAKLLPWAQRLQLATTGTAYDVTVGLHLCQQYGPAVFEHLVPLSSTFSYYGNCLYSEQDRRNMLAAKQIVAVHQIKSNWRGPK